MLKIKSIINLLQNEQVLYLDSNQESFIVKDSANTYLICSDYYDSGIQYCNLNELKSFIKHHEAVFIDIFKDDTKFINRNSKTNDIDLKMNEYNEMDELDSINFELNELDNYRAGYRLSLRYRLYK